MKNVLTVWFVFLFASVTFSVLGLSWVQSRLIKREGWRVFRTHRFLDLYWHDLGSLERLLIWPGLIAFLLTLVAASLDHLLHRT